MSNGPRFLDEEPAVQQQVSDAAPSRGTAPSAEAGLPRGPVLLDAPADPLARLDVGWTPELVAAPRVRVGAAFWIGAGLCLLVASWVVLSIVSFVLALFQQGMVLGAVGAIAIGSAACMMLYAALLEAAAYQSLGNVEQLRAVLAARDAPIEAVRARAQEWLGQVGEVVADTSTVARLIQGAGTVVEVRGILRNRVVDPLRQKAAGLGRRAAAEGATLVAICPHPAWDGLIAGVRGLLVIRGVAALYGLRPGFVVTLALLRRVAWTAAGTTGLSLVSQGLADHVLTNMPFVKHVASAIPGTGAVAVRLYRLADVTAEACCPLSG